MGAMTRTRQLTTAGEGLAVGLLSVDAPAIPTDTAAAAFRYGWSRWAHASAFPQVRADMFRNDILLQLVGRSERRRGLVVAAWTQDAELHPYLCDDTMSCEEAADFLRGECGFDLAGWQQLATLMLEWVRKTARPADDEIAAGPTR
jgi:hypothetical protein